MPKYVGRRIVPKHGGIWDKTKEYEELIIVLCQETGVSYISKLPVPAGTEAPKFYVTDHHVPIINRAVWMRAQEILAHRKKNRTKKEG